jgi:hypothetical protein
MKLVTIGFAAALALSGSLAFAQGAGGGAGGAGGGAGGGDPGLAKAGSPTASPGSTASNPKGTVGQTRSMKSEKMKGGTNGTISPHAGSNNNNN